MNILLFHLMPYADLDLEATRDYPTPWVTLPNSFYDPKKGHALYNRYLDELEYGEALGFDGLCVNEHHQTAYGIMPSPIVTAAALSRRTSKARIAILGSALPLRANPLTVAEEHAMIDVITGGRVISGFVRGVGSEYFSFGTNPVHSLERHKEAADLVIKAWTQPGPFRWEGTHYQRTAEHWLKNMDAHRDEILPLFATTYGAAQATKWWAYWRVFYLACAELWGYRRGEEWLVSHYLFRRTE